MLVLAQNSYITLDAARTYATENGLELPGDDLAAEVLLTRAAKALDRRFGSRYLGYKAAAANPMQWPRHVGTLTDSDGNPADLTGIPAMLGEAQVEMAILIDAGTDPIAQNSPGVLSEKVKVGDLETDVSYAKPTAPTSEFNTVMVILRPILKQQHSLNITRGY